MQHKRICIRNRKKNKHNVRWCYLKSSRKLKHFSFLQSVKFGLRRRLNLFDAYKKLTSDCDTKMRCIVIQKLFLQSLELSTVMTAVDFDTFKPRKSRNFILLSILLISILFFFLIHGTIKAWHYFKCGFFISLCSLLCHKSRKFLLRSFLTKNRIHKANLLKLKGHKILNLLQLSAERHKNSIDNKFVTVRSAK